MDTSRTLFNFSDSINVQIVDQNIQNMQTYHNRILLLRFLALYNSYFATQLCIYEFTSPYMYFLIYLFNSFLYFCISVFLYFCIYLFIILILYFFGSLFPFFFMSLSIFSFIFFFVSFLFVSLFLCFFIYPFTSLFFTANKSFFIFLIFLDTI